MHDGRKIGLSQKFITIIPFDSIFRQESDFGVSWARLVPLIGRIEPDSPLLAADHGVFNSFHQNRRFLDGNCSHKMEESIEAHLEAINCLNRA
ncbi:hypothetical protein JCGZ_11853 [Jatropha curcas]|uniref:Uncharacterized protein n=1 Tax=Jatropha curcas TaxID=180498 RepID=A0A067LMC1_JATCU|nr:hypothetical protein JCGZ_11853 [Jatropha curcas]